MVIPLPPMPASSGSCSAYARSRQSLVLAVLLSQSFFCVMRCWMLLDIWGGFMMGVGLGFGWYGYSQDMHTTFLSYWGIFCFANGILDFVQLIDYSVKIGIMWDLAGCTRVGIPLATLLGVPIAWFLYKDATDSAYSVSGGSWGGAETAPLRGSGAATGNQFQSFSGDGQRLGTV